MTGVGVSCRTQVAAIPAGSHIAAGLAFFLLGILAGCSSSATAVSTCAASFEGTSWTPEVDGAGDCNHSDTGGSGVELNTWSTTASAVVTGLGDSIAGRVLTVSNIPVTDDLLDGGSLTLTAETQGLPAPLQNNAWPVLISLHDGTNELVGGMEAGCASGFFTCSGNSCTNRNSSCAPDQAGTAGSAFLGDSALKRRQNWEEHQGIYFDPSAVKYKFGLIMDGVSVNTFPSCNWATGTPTCHFNSAPGSFFSSGKLRTGTYTAKYVLLADSYTSVPSSYTANVKITAVKKRDNNNASTGCNSATGHKGAVDVNVILVGDRNVRDSRTAKGKQNLNALFQHVHDQLSAGAPSQAAIRLGKLTVYEWSCLEGGDAYSNTSDYSALFKVGSAKMPSETEGKALNVFLVSTIAGSSSILGLSGGINGPSVNGTRASGLVFASFNKLASFNTACNGSGTCTINNQEASFIDMGGTITHEIGHYLGLNHPSESTGTMHDPVPDTPECTNTASTSVGVRLTLNSCRADSSTVPSGSTCASACGGYNGTTVFCPTAVQCQFNHVMWYTTKNYGSGGTGDGNLFSANSGTVINYSPLVR